MGAIIGTLLDIDGPSTGLGARWRRGMAAAARGASPRALFTASLLFCIGAMTIRGLAERRPAGGHSLLFTKSTWTLSLP
jgi:uncharacterized membrane protein YqgA involved in biofilm formation